MMDILRVRSRGGGGFSRLQSSLCVGIFGPVIFIGSLCLLIWNEVRSVRAYGMISECRSKFVEAPCDTAPAGDAIVHFSCALGGYSTILDSDMNVSAYALGIGRTVEMLQWDEREVSRTCRGNTCDTRYSYSKVWSQAPIGSGGFRDGGVHANPSGPWPYTSRTFETPSPVTAGVFALPRDIAQTLTTCTTDACSSSLGPPRMLSAVGEDTVGASRVSFRVANASAVSVVALWSGGTLVPYESSGHSCYYSSPGIVSARDMFGAAETRNRNLAWALRAVGIMGMFFGMLLAASVIMAVLAAFPFFGQALANAAGAAVLLLAFVVSLSVGFATIGIAWIAVRPVVGGAVLVGAVAFGSAATAIVHVLRKDEIRPQVPTVRLGLKF